MNIDLVVLSIATLIGLYMAANIGANDLANAMGTSVGSGAITLKQAVVISIIANTLGAVLAGGYVTNTISKGMIDPALLAGEPTKFMLGMFAALTSAGIWVNMATYFGLPVSTTHAIVGAVVGFGILGVGFGGVSWTKIDQGLPDKWSSRVEASRHEMHTVYASFTGFREDDFEKYLYMSTDYGRSWSSITGNLPSESINVVREDPRNKNILYVGTDLGVYTSLDRGAKWYSLCNNLPTTPVHDMAVHPRDNELIIGTHGRSVFILDVKDIQEYKEKPQGRPIGHTTETATINMILIACNPDFSHSTHSATPSTHSATLRAGFFSHLGHKLRAG